MIVLENSLNVRQITVGVQDKGGKFMAKFGMMLSPHVIRRRDFVSRFDKKDKLIQNVIKEGRVIFGKHFEEVMAHEPKETSRHVSEAEAKSYLKKAEEFYQTMLESYRQRRWNSAGKRVLWSTTLGARPT